MQKLPIDPHVEEIVAHVRPDGALPPEGPQSLAEVARQAMLKAERDLIIPTLRRVHWNRRKAAPLLGISYKTADSHRSRILEKLGVHETASMVRYAIRAGLVEA